PRLKPTRCPMTEREQDSLPTCDLHTRVHSPRPEDRSEDGAAAEGERDEPQLPRREPGAEGLAPTDQPPATLATLRAPGAGPTATMLPQAEDTPEEEETAPLGDGVAAVPTSPATMTPRATGTEVEPSD